MPRFDDARVVSTDQDLFIQFATLKGIGCAVIVLEKMSTKSSDGRNMIQAIAFGLTCIVFAAIGALTSRGARSDRKNSIREDCQGLRLKAASVGPAVIARRLSIARANVDRAPGTNGLGDAGDRCA